MFGLTISTCSQSGEKSNASNYSKLLSNSSIAELSNMNNTFSSPFLGVFTNRFQDASPYALTPSHYVVLLTVLITSISILSSGRKTKIPLLNGPAWWQPTLMKKLEYLKSGMGTLAEGRAKSKGKAFRLITELGDMLILPNRYCNEIRNNLDLNFRQAIMEVCCHAFLSLTSICNDQNLTLGRISIHISRDLRPLHCLVINHRFCRKLCASS